MKGQMFTHSTAIVLGLLASVFLLVVYSYIKHGDLLKEGFFAMINAGLNDFTSLFQGNSVLVIILFFMGFAIGYLLGKASY